MWNTHYPIDWHIGWLTQYAKPLHLRRRGTAPLERPNARRVQLDLFYDYRTNVELYPKWQAFLKTQQPKTIILPGAERCLLHARGWRGLPQGFARCRNASSGGRPLCSGGLAERDRQWHARFLREQGSAQRSPASECLRTMAGLAGGASKEHAQDGRGVERPPKK